jgi:hypothetical protein
VPTLSDHILGMFPDWDEGKVGGTRNQFWNAIKHFYWHARTPRKTWRYEGIVDSLVLLVSGGSDGRSAGLL